MNQKRPSDFEKQAAEVGGGFFSEFWVFLKDNKKWWLLPILLAFLLMGALLLAGGTGAAPFIYTLF
jgi:drug/metabolite transporter superfamily protein YnfA